MLINPLNNYSPFQSKRRIFYILQNLSTWNIRITHNGRDPLTWSRSNYRKFLRNINPHILTFY